MSKFSSYDFKDQRALIRVDFNVPLNEKYEITDDTRIKAAIPTIRKILDDGGSVVLMSHLGRPKDGPTEKYSLKHLVIHLRKLLQGATIFFANDCIGEEAKQMAEDLQPEEILLLENLRFYKEEEKGDKAFAQKLAKLGDVYVNDAFGTAHRAHSSTAVIAEFFPPDKKMFGLLMENEIANAEKVLNSSQKPFTAIIGGAKVSDKILILENLLDKATDIIIGGGMAYTFEKAQGGHIGNSLCEKTGSKLQKNYWQRPKQRECVFIFPSDSLIADKFSNEAETSTAPSNNIPRGWMGLDIGSQCLRAVL
jgi:phosphoglycerate kinase